VHWSDFLSCQLIYKKDKNVKKRFSGLKSKTHKKVVAGSTVIPDAGKTLF
jgi:hypothetical protein